MSCATFIREPAIRATPLSSTSIWSQTVNITTSIQLHLHHRDTYAPNQARSSVQIEPQAHSFFIARFAKIRASHESCTEIFMRIDPRFLVESGTEIYTGSEL